ncbi:hypothetical protein [Thiolapillus sp.]
MLVTRITLFTTSLMLIASTSLAGSAAIVPVQPVIAAETLSAAPWQIRVSLYRNRDDARPVAQQLFSPDDWQTDRNLDEGLPETGGIRFRMRIEADESDGIHPGDTLWAETRVDGQALGERFQVQAVAPPKFTIEGEIETKGASGGIRFPDGSFQDSASPAVAGGGMNAGSSGIMWIAGKDAFRAGGVDGDQWAADEQLTGQVSVTNGSTTVTGSGTLFSSEIGVGDHIRLGGSIYPVSSVTSDTSLEIAPNANSTFIGAAYAVRVGIGSIAIGWNTMASGYGSTAMGRSTTASGYNSTAMGVGTTASGSNSTAMGIDTTVSGYASTAMGARTTASGSVSTAMGVDTIASGSDSTAMGWGTEADDDLSLVIGRFNSLVGDNYFVVGNGADVSNRSNALVLTKSGNLGVGSPTPGNRMSFFGAPSDTWGDNRLAYVGLIKNTLTTNAHSGDVLALQTSATGNVGTAANFIGFFNAGGALIGQIEGNGSGGVAYNTTGADYAEYLPRKHPDESLEAGDVVGVYGGSITRDTRNADQVMVITDRAAVLGNAPQGQDEARGHEAVSFIGQVPVKVRGVVNSGDLIIASGRNDGTAMAVSPAGVASLDRAQIIGRAWQSSNEPGLKKVRVAVGLDRSDIAMEAMGQVRQLKTLVTRQQAKIAALETALSRYENLAAEVSRLKTQLAGQQPLMAVKQ